MTLDEIVAKVNFATGNQLMSDVDLRSLIRQYGKSIKINCMTAVPEEGTVDDAVDAIRKVKLDGRPYSAATIAQPNEPGETIAWTPGHGISEEMELKYALLKSARRRLERG